MTATSVNNRLIPLKAALKFLKIPRNIMSIGLGSGVSCSQWCRTRMQSQKSWTKGDPHTKPLICKAESNVQARTKQENVVLFHDTGIFQLPLQENKSKKILLY